MTEESLESSALWLSPYLIHQIIHRFLMPHLYRSLGTRESPTQLSASQLTSLDCEKNLADNSLWRSSMLSNYRAGERGGGRGSVEGNLRCNPRSGGPSYLAGPFACVTKKKKKKEKKKKNEEEEKEEARRRREVQCNPWLRFTPQ